MSLPVLLEQPNNRGALIWFCRSLEVWYGFFPPSAAQKESDNKENSSFAKDLLNAVILHRSEL